VALRDKGSRGPVGGKGAPDLRSMRGLGYIQLSPVDFTLPHMYICPPPARNPAQGATQSSRSYRGGAPLWRRAAGQAPENA